MGFLLVFFSTSKQNYKGVHLHRLCGGHFDSEIHWTSKPKLMENPSNIDERQICRWSMEPWNIPTPMGRHQRFSLLLDALVKMLWWILDDSRAHKFMFRFLGLVALLLAKCWDCACFFALQPQHVMVDTPRISPNQPCLCYFCIYNTIYNIYVLHIFMISCTCLYIYMKARLTPLSQVTTVGEKRHLAEAVLWTNWSLDSVGCFFLACFLFGERKRDKKFFFSGDLAAKA